MDLAQRLRDARPERFEVTCLPDFFVDVVVPMAPWPVARDQMAAVAERRGGNLATAQHLLSQGGNAANCALALARLGVRSRLIAPTNALGMSLAELWLRGVDLSRVRADGALSSTVALEFGPERRNVMLSHPGDIADFGPEDLTDQDWAVIEDSDLVLVGNWVLNRNGTALAARVLERAGRAGVTTYFDSGDPGSRAGEVPTLFNSVLASPWLRVLACNENELGFFAAAAGDVRSTSLLDRARSVKREVAATLDVHTRDVAMSLGAGNALAEAKPPPLEGKRATGAGDAWNAGNILGYLLELPAEERLRVANAVATLYVTNAEPAHPKLEDVAALVARR
ncbi:MAG TPA: carbohydrate kinase family protein [Candidatus Thermoplasmatota archaeon]|nr:carbohydrate kinase family protein [Candidatus Thermoplasmatota archaeon]